MTKILKHPTDDSLSQAAEHLIAGGLVAFPTETVYGLGAHAANANAVQSIYAVKRRPPTDPLIVHVNSIGQADDLVDKQKANDWQRAVLHSLAAKFWPGPLTLILPANLKSIAFEVTSSTGWVGLRQPAHPVAQAFLSACGVPVAAPSANLFGHVSPTTAEHVAADFPHVDKLWIVDGGRCGFGIESTVVRINAEATLDVFRRGGVGPTELGDTLIKAGLLKSQADVRIIEKYSAEASSQAEVAPGQLLVHYAPRIYSQMITLNGDDESAKNEISADELQRTIIIDFAGQLSELRGRVGFYRDLSASGDLREAVFSLFDALRWAETCGEQNSRLWIFDPRSVARRDDELLLALQDRIIRSASGRGAVVRLKPDSGRVFVSVR